MANGRIVYTPQIMRALTFDESHFASLPDDPAFDMGTSDFTLDVLFRVDSDITLTTQKLLIGKNNAYSLANKSGWQIYIEQGYEPPSFPLAIVFGLNDGQATPITISSWDPYPNGGSIEANTWYWAALRADRSGLGTIFLNGQSVNSGNISGRDGSLSNAIPLYLGNWGATADRYFKGYMGLVRIWKGALPDDAWFQQEWDRIRYGLRRRPQSAVEMWEFAESLTGKNGNILVLNAGDPVYVSGYPYADGAITLNFEHNFAYGHTAGYAEGIMATERARDGTLWQYLLGEAKEQWVLPFTNIKMAQLTVLKGIFESQSAFQFSPDANNFFNLNMAMVTEPMPTSEAAFLDGEYTWDVEAEVAEI